MRSYRSEFGGSVAEIELTVLVFEETTGLFFEELVYLVDVPVTGHSDYTPATWMDPPEYDDDITSDLSVEALREQVQWSLEDDYGRVTLVDAARVLSQVDELVAEKVRDDPETYLHDYGY